MAGNEFRLPAGAIGKVAAAVNADYALVNGLPAGGTVGQVLQKTLIDDYAFDWQDAPAGSGGGSTYTPELGDVPVLNLAGQSTGEPASPVVDALYFVVYPIVMEQPAPDPAWDVRYFDGAVWHTVSLAIGTLLAMGGTYMKVTGDHVIEDLVPAAAGGSSNVDNGTVDGQLAAWSTGDGIYMPTDFVIPDNTTGTQKVWDSTTKTWVTAPTNGTDGLSAYQLAVNAGFVGTEAEWLASLSGTDGISAYQAAVNAGFVGTEAQWLASLEGSPGLDGLSAYQLAVNGGFVGTEAQWIASLTGATGAGVKNGGTTGQVLVKNSNTDYDTLWKDLTHVTVVTVTGDTTLGTAHDGAYVRVNAAAATNITVPPNSTTAFTIGTVIQLRQVGAGQIVVNAGGGVTITSPGLLTSRAQNSTLVLIKVDTDTWELSGDVGVA